jgi:hypothetical protein
LVLWQRILVYLEKSPESLMLMKDIPEPPPFLKQDMPAPRENPLKTLLESGFIGCFEAESDLSVNYKAEFGKLVDEKYGHR